MIQQQVKRFATEKAAEKWARAFDYARSLLGLAPLTVKQDGEQWAVEKPENNK